MRETRERVHGCRRQRAELGEDHGSQIPRIDHRLTRGELTAAHRESPPALRELTVESGEHGGNPHAGRAIGIERRMLRGSRVVTEDGVVDAQHAARSVRLDQHEIAVLIAAELGRHRLDSVAFASDQRGVVRADVRSDEPRAVTHPRPAARPSASRRTSSACRASELP